MKITVLLEFLQKPKVNWYYKVAVHRNHPCMGGMGGRGGGGGGGGGGGLYICFSSLVLPPLSLKE